LNPQGDHGEEGFQFPGPFELTVMGAAEVDLAALVAVEMQVLGIQSEACDAREKRSSGGRFRSLTAAFTCTSREQLEELHAALRAHPAVKWTL